MSIFITNPDIRQAETLSSQFYINPAFFDQSKERIFARSWQIVGGTEDVRLAGQMKPHILLEGFLDEPVLLTRDGADKIHCLSNVCTHRGNILVEGAGVENQIRCRYHGKRFKLDGKFVSMPEFEGAVNFPTEADNLPHVPFDVWGALLFASVNPIAPLKDFIGEMHTRLDWFDWNSFRFSPARSRDYLVGAHWALYCENYLEGLHIPFIHNSLNNAVDYGSYTTELFPRSTLQLGLSGGGCHVFDLPETSLDFGKQVAAYYFWIFPNLMFNFYPWGYR